MSTVAIISLCWYFLNVSRRSLIDQNTKQVCPLSSDKKQWLLGVATKNKNKTELFLFISLAVETSGATETIIERLGADNTDNESAIVVMWYQLSVSSNKQLLLHIVFLWHLRHDLKYVMWKPWTLLQWKVSNREVTCGEDIMILWSLQLLQLLPATKMGVMTFPLLQVPSDHFSVGLWPAVDWCSVLRWDEETFPCSHSKSPKSLHLRPNFTLKPV